MASSKQQPVVPVEHFNEREHRRLLAVRANAALTPVLSGLTAGQLLRWDGEAWVNDGESGTWTPTLAFGGADTGITYPAGGNRGAYDRIGDFVFLSAIVALSNKGSATGAATIAGLPFSVADLLTATSLEGLCNVPYALNMAGLTSPITAVVTDTDLIAMYDWGGSGVTEIDDANFTNTSTIRIQAVYLTDD